MSIISTTEEHILAFAKYARSSDDENMREISDNMLLFFEANKNRIDLNAENAFEELYYKEVEKSQNESESLSKISNFQIFTEFSNCYDKLKTSALNEDEATAEFKEKVKDIQEFENNFVTLQGELSKNLELQDEKEQLKTEIKGLKNGFVESEPIKFDDLFEGFSLKVQPVQMFEFINNKEQNEFPFSNEDTLKNTKFIYAFYKETLGKSNHEIRNMIEKVKEKNRILEQEINEFKNEKAALLTELAENLSENQKLTQLKTNQDEALADTIIAEATQEIRDDDIKEVKTTSDSTSEQLDGKEKNKQTNQVQNYDLVSSDFIENDTLPISNTSDWQTEMFQTQQKAEKDTENISKKRYRQ